MDMDIIVPNIAQLTPGQHSQRLRRDHERCGHITEPRDDTSADLRPPPSTLERHCLGPCNDVCPHCGALHWKVERLSCSTYRRVHFGMCCGDGDKILQSIIEPPEALRALLTSQCHDVVMFRKHVRQYNAAFAFTSLGVQLDERFMHGHDKFSPFQCDNLEWC
jgi:hypothetical protein